MISGTAPPDVPTPRISLQGAPLHGWNLIFKRTFDVLLSLTALVLSAPILLVTFALVKLTRALPVFVAPRLGSARRPGPKAAQNGTSASRWCGGATAPQGATYFASS